MPTLDLAHANLRAERPLLDRLCAFYCEVVGLTLGPRPPFRSFGYWLYAADRAVLHLTETAPGEMRTSQAPGTFDHLAFRCVGRAAFEARLVRLGVAYRCASVPLTGEVQLFFEDPAGNGVELGFDEEVSPTASDSAQQKGVP